MTGEQAEKLLDHLPGGVLLIEEDLVVDTNIGAAELLGVSQKRLHRSKLSTHLPPQAGEVTQRILAGASSCIYRNVRWDRPFSTDQLRITGAPGPKPNQVLLLLTAEDDLLASDAARGFRRRLKWLDSLAAGMAHEIRNPLGGIRGAAQLLGRDLAPLEQQELTELIIRESDRIDTLVERLMSLCRPRPMMRGKHSLNRIIHDEVALLQARGGRSNTLSFELDLDPSLPTVEGDEERIREAASNLLRNAIEAASDRIVIRTRVDSDQRLSDEGQDRGRPIALEVTDDGPGIDPERRSTLFDPFSTTKAEGTGLGLFVTRLVIDEHGGQLLLEPRPQLGARFTLIFFERLPGRNETDLNTWADSLHSKPHAAWSQAVELNA